ncbi:N-acyl-L-homoserine lactone synthetase [Roseovarius pacificus]|uniref:N-acyl-L-homoserine lactone synthetase n=2 Tax=Roseovarius pacificus TaxID=337701 RepID=A0A1M6XUC9_9RHOB|nr:N-acyl-L-homoserine lactone synthetase [Roseovarius pacificus]
MNRSWSPFRAPSETPDWPNPASLTTPENARGIPSGFMTRGKASKREKPASKIKSVTMGFRTMHEHGDLLVKYLEARKTIFLDQLKWDVCEADGMEFDQYDTPACQWVVLHEFGEVLGGVRMLPTMAKCGIYSYMLRDAQRGLLESLPTDVLFIEAPVEYDVWEASRFFVTDIVPASRRLEVEQLLFKGMTQVAVDNGAKYILGIVPAIWSRWARRLGVSATPIGAKFTIDGTTSQSVLFNAQGFVI